MKNARGDTHLRRWGALYILLCLWVGSWAGQLSAQIADGEGWTEFLASTFENWQSEFLQLAVQAVLIVGAADKLFRVAKADSEEIKTMLDVVLRNQKYLDSQLGEPKD